MLKKEITYTDYNNETRTETFYFNLNKAELMEMELTTPGGMSGVLKRITETNDTPELFKAFKELILRSYGEMDLADKRRFHKSPELSKAFTETEAYSELFMELSTDADAAAAFVNGIIPSALRAEMEKLTPEEIKELTA